MGTPTQLDPNRWVWTNERSRFDREIAIAKGGRWQRLGNVIAIGAKSEGRRIWKGMDGCDLIGRSQSRGVEGCHGRSCDCDRGEIAISVGPSDKKNGSTMEITTEA